MTNVEKIITGVLLALLAALLFALYRQASECEDKGGVLVRGAFGNACVKLEKVK